MVCEAGRECDAKRDVPSRPHTTLMSWFLVPSPDFLAGLDGDQGHVSDWRARKRRQSASYLPLSGRQSRGGARCSTGTSRPVVRNLSSALRSVCRNWWSGRSNSTPVGGVERAGKCTRTSTFRLTVIRGERDRITPAAALANAGQRDRRTLPRPSCNNGRALTAVHTPGSGDPTLAHAFSAARIAGEAGFSPGSRSDRIPQPAGPKVGSGKPGTPCSRMHLA